MGTTRTGRNASGHIITTPEMVAEDGSRRKGSGTAEAPERTDEEKRMLKKAAWYSEFMDKRKPPTALIGEPEEED